MESTMTVPKIIYTKANNYADDCEVVDDDRRLSISRRQLRLARTRSRCSNSKRCERDESTSSSSRSPSPSKRAAEQQQCTTGYQQYLNQLLKVPQWDYSSNGLEYGEASGDDLSSEWDSDQSESKKICVYEIREKVGNRGNF